MADDGANLDEGDLLAKLRLQEAGANGVIGGVAWPSCRRFAAAISPAMGKPAFLIIEQRRLTAITRGQAG